MVVHEFSWFGHHVFLRSISIEGIVVNKDPLRIGSGREIAKFSPIDMPILRVAGNPTIPGSTWKGVFRSACYRLGVSSSITGLCQGIPQGQCLSGKEFENIEVGRYADEISEKIKAIAEGTIKVCLLCLIFGSSGLSSHVYFEDSFPISSYSIGYRTCVAIDRRTGAAFRGALYTVEYVEPGAKFGFRMVANNLPNYALGLLAEVFTEIQSGIVKIGGHKSRGFGRVEFENLRITVMPYGLGKGVIEGKLVALDPIDEDVTWPSDKPVIEGNDSWGFLSSLSQVWRKCSAKIAEISRNNWKWSIISE